MLHPGGGGKPREPRGTLDVEQLEPLPSALVKNADGRDHRARAGKRRREPRLVVETGIERLDLADIAHRLRRNCASEACRLTAAMTAPRSASCFTT